MYRRKSYLLVFLWVAFTLPLFAVESGQKAPTFTLPELSSGKTVALDALKGDVVLLNFWASWCKGCAKEMPEFVSLQKSYPKGFRIVAVSLDSSSQKARSFMKKLGNTPFIVLYDAQRTAAKLYDVQAMPSSYLIDKHGKVREVIVGSLTHDDIRALKTRIDTLRKER